MASPSAPPRPRSGSRAPRFRERLLPGPGLFLVLLLLIPAVLLTMLPLNRELAWPVAVGMYVIITVSLAVMAPSVRVVDGLLIAGPAQIPVRVLGDGDVLDRDALRAAIGPGLDARSYLLIRGYIHTGVRIANLDPSDPAPQWIITSRRPEHLLAAIAEERNAHSNDAR